MSIYLTPSKAMSLLAPIALDVSIWLSSGGALGIPFTAGLLGSMAALRAKLIFPIIINTLDTVVLETLFVKLEYS
jgi:hypothetical protein